MLRRMNEYTKQVEDILTVLQALNDPTRQEIIMLFQEKPEYCVTGIANQFKLSRPTISHHLNLMKRARILTSRKEGKEIYFSFNKDFVIGQLEMLVRYLKGCC
jgi:DNA-binding transcriptional ArsR family regulator